MSNSSPIIDPPIFNTNSIIGSSGIFTSGYNGNYTIGLDLQNTQDFRNLCDRVDEIEKMLCILKPNFELMEKYAALKEAYDAYQIVLKLIQSGENGQP